MNERLFSMIKVSTVVTALLLSACGGPAKIVTQDESADYKSARSLPPLKKPSLQKTQAPVSAQTETPSPEPVYEPQVEDLPAATPIPEVVEPAEVAIVEEPVVEEPVILEEQIEPEISETSIEPEISEAPIVEPEPEPEPEPVYQPSSESLDVSGIRAEVIAPNASVSRLQLSAPFDESWSYITASLLKSDITVHTRNKAAGRFAIGCGDIASAPEASRKGGWSFFDKKRVASEYCSLQLVSSKKNTIVSVINQSGAEVESSAASSVFNRLLNN